MGGWGCCHNYLLSQLRVYYSRRQLNIEHLAIMEATKDRQETIQIQALWANRGWAESIGNMFTELVADECLRKVGLLGRPEGDEGRKSQREAASRFVELVTASAAQRAWSMSIWSECPPLNFAGILSEDISEGRSAFQRMKHDAQVVTRLLRADSESCNKQTMQALWGCCGVHAYKCAHGCTCARM